MAKSPTYHVGCGVFGIYAGTLMPRGDMWRNKSEVTNEALCAAAQHLLENKKKLRFQYKGEWYVLEVTKDAAEPGISD